MSRVIKFRVWHDGDKAWVNNKYLFDNCLNPFDQYGSFITEREEYSLKFQQFTGLKDKNGVEIYEGDIIQCYIDETTGLAAHEFKIVWDNNNYCWALADKKGFSLAHTGWKFYHASRGEVIGNIFENKA